jgi:hypothetical protein
MRKHSFKALFLSAMLTATSFSAFANEVFIVCDSTPFSLVMDTAGVNYTQTEWYDYGNTTTPIATTQALTDNIALNIPATAEEHQFLARGYNDTCWSSFDTITVYVLPALTASITAQNATNCSNSFSTDTLTANSNFTSLNFSAVQGSTIGVNDYSWVATNAGAGTAFGTGNSGYSVIHAGTYTVTISYDTGTFPANDGIKVTCDGVNSIDIAVYPAPGIPAVTIQ